MTLRASKADLLENGHPGDTYGCFVLKEYFGTRYVDKMSPVPTSTMPPAPFTSPQMDWLLVATAPPVDPGDLTLIFENRLI